MTDSIGPYLCHHDTDNEGGSYTPLRRALRRYHDTYGVSAQVVLTSPLDAHALRRWNIHSRRGHLTIIGRAFVARSTFYLARRGDAS